jgi:hypothetical protein
LAWRESMLACQVDFWCEAPTTTSSSLRSPITSSLARAADRVRHHVLRHAAVRAVAGAPALPPVPATGDAAAASQRSTFSALHVDVDHHAAVRLRRRHVDADAAALHDPRPLRLFWRR